MRNSKICCETVWLVRYVAKLCKRGEAIGTVRYGSIRCCAIWYDECAAGTMRYDTVLFNIIK